MFLVEGCLDLVKYVFLYLPVSVHRDLNFYGSMASLVFLNSEKHLSRKKHQKYRSLEQHITQLIDRNQKPYSQ